MLALNAARSHVFDDFAVFFEVLQWTQAALSSRRLIRAYRHAYIHIHTFIHAYIHTFIHTYVHTFVHAYIHTFIHTYIHVRTYARIRRDVRSHTDMRTYMQTCMHTSRTYIHTDIHTHTHTMHTWQLPPSIRQLCFSSTAAELSHGACVCLLHRHHGKFNQMCSHWWKIVMHSFSCSLWCYQKLWTPKQVQSQQFFAKGSSTIRGRWLDL